MNIIKFIILGILFFLAGYGLKSVIGRPFRRNVYIGTLIIFKDDTTQDMGVELVNDHIIQSIKETDRVEMDIRIIKS